MRMSTMALVSFWAFSGALLSEERLNVILFLADDLGWNGLGCYGSDLHETPNLDRLAGDGMKFTSAYSACTVCSPTRASVMTGKYPARLHLTDFISGQKRPHARLRVPDWNKKLELGEVTIAEALKSVGYATAHVGKWHLGPATSDPVHQGFDVQVIKPRSKGYFIAPELVEDGTVRSAYLTDHLTDEALKIVERLKDQPFFLYFPYHTPHTPIQGKKELVEYYQTKVKSTLVHQNPTYAAMVQSLDESVGRVLAGLKKAGIAERTVVIFCSDNGGLSVKFGKPTGFGDNSPLRRGKGSAYEGGVRVPLIVKWPGVTRPGSVCREPVSTIDFYPTVLEICAARGDAGHNRDVDGLSLVPLLKSPAGSLERTALFWHYPHYHAGGDSPYGAVRARDFRLVQFYENGTVELYNLKSDPGETMDLSGKMPEKTAELREMLERWRTAVNAQMPTPNPDHDPEKARRMARGEKG